MSMEQYREISKTEDEGRARDIEVLSQETEACHRLVHARIVEGVSDAEPLLREEYVTLLDELSESEHDFVEESDDDPDARLAAQYAHDELDMQVDDGDDSASGGDREETESEAESKAK
jgi:hypothetical protein